MKVTDVHCLVKASSKALISVLDTEFKYTVELAPEDEGWTVLKADHITTHRASEELSVQKILVLCNDRLKSIAYYSKAYCCKI